MTLLINKISKYGALTVLLLCVLVLWPDQAAAQVDAVIDHEPIRSAPSGKRINIAARVEDDAGVDIARVYFKAIHEEAFLFVPMRLEEQKYMGTTPAPAPRVGIVQYLILVRNQEGIVYKSETFEIEVTDSDKSVSGDRDPIQVFTELAEAPETISGFTDNVVLDVVESSAKYGVVAGITAEGAAGTSAASVGGASGGVAGSSVGMGTLGTVGIGAAAAAAVAGVVGATQDAQDEENRAPEFSGTGTLNLNVDENSGGAIGSPVTATDPDGDALTYRLVGDGASSFEIDATGQLSVASTTTLDYETQSVYSFEVEVSDGALSATRAVSVTVTDVNEAPEFSEADALELSVGENSVGSIGSPVTATDPDGDALTYRLVGDGASSFEIDAAGQLSVASTTTLDYETQSVYSFEVEVSDGALSATRAVSVTVTDVNEAPEFSEAGTLELSVGENSVGSIGSPVTATDPDGDTLTYHLVGDVASSFEIDAAGQLSVASTTTLDYETQSVYSFEVEVSDGAFSATRAVSVTVTDVNEVPGAVSGITVEPEPLSDTELRVTWMVPDNNGPAITGYELRYRKTGETDWVTHELESAETGTVLTSLENGVNYEVAIRAINEEGAGAWSAVVKGKTSGLQGQPGEVRVNLAWDAAGVDLDLHVEDPCGGTIYFSNPRASCEGRFGELDVDDTIGGMGAVENIAWPEAPHGRYSVKVNYYSGFGPADYTVTIQYGDVTETYTGSLNGGSADIAEFTYTPVEEGSLASDWRALVALYNATNGDQWEANDNWSSDTSRVPTSEELDSWLGVFVSEGRVTGLFLSSLTISGPIPTELGNLSQLDNLNLGSNRLTGPIPSELGNLSQLDNLNLGSNRLTGPIPSELSNLSKLAVLNLGGNELAGPIPPELGNLSKLDHLDLEYNELTGPIPPELGNLSMLEVLYLGINKLTGPIPSELGNLSKLEDLRLGARDNTTYYLDLAPNELTGPIPASFLTLANLSTFYWQQSEGIADPLCVPNNNEFDDWLADITQWFGPRCENDATGVGAAPAPLVESVSLVSHPGAAGFYGLGEKIEVAVRFNEPIAVEGAPRLWLDIGNARVAADYDHLSSASVLVFRYSVSAGDQDTDGVSVYADALWLNGGAITAVGGAAGQTSLAAHMIENAAEHIVEAGVLEAEREILEDALAAQGRAHLASAADVIGARFRPEASSINLLSMDLEGQLTGVLATSPIDWFTRGGYGVSSAGGPLADGPGAAPGGHHNAPLEATGSKSPSSVVGGSLGALAGRTFSVSFGGDDGEGRQKDWTLWGVRDMQTFAGKTASGGYDGDLRSNYLGIDGRIGRGWLAGVALARSDSELAYDFGSGSVTGDGLLHTRLTSVYPYVHGRIWGGMEVWAIAGAGTGDALVERDAAEGMASSVLALRLGSFGVRRDLMESGSLKLSLVSDAGFTQLRVDEDGTDVMSGLSASVGQVRIGVEGEHTLAFAGDTTLHPFWRLSGRYDGGDGITGEGLEVSGGSRYRFGRLEAEAHARWLAAHSSSNSRELGASATLTVLPKANGGGFTVRLTPRWGASGVGDARSMWGEQALRPSEKSHRLISEPWSLDGLLGYGISLPGTRGLLTPFADFRMVAGSTLRQRFGFRLERGDGDRWQLSAELATGVVKHPNSRITGGASADRSVDGLLKFQFWP